MLVHCFAALHDGDVLVRAGDVAVQGGDVSVGDAAVDVKIDNGRAF
jgi:hypothetical protein